MIIWRQVTQLSKGFTLMKAQLKMAKDGVTKLEGDKFADVVEPFLEGAKVLSVQLSCRRALFCVRLRDMRAFERY